MCNRYHGIFHPMMQQANVYITFPMYHMYPLHYGELLHYVTPIAMYRVQHGNFCWTYNFQSGRTYEFQGTV